MALASKQADPGTAAGPQQAAHAAAANAERAHAAPQTLPDSVAAQVQDADAPQQQSLRVPGPRAEPKRSSLLGIKQHPISKPVPLKPLTGLFKAPARTPRQLITPSPAGKVLQPLAQLRLGTPLGQAPAQQVVAYRALGEPHGRTCPR